MSAVAASFETSSIEQSPELLGEAIVRNTLHLILLNEAEGREVGVQVEPVQELFHVGYWAEGNGMVGHHRDNHVLVSELVCFTVVEKDQANVTICRKTYFHP